MLEVRQLRREALQLRMAATMGTQVQQTSASQQGGGQSGRQGAPHGDALLLGAEAAEVSGVDGHGRDGEARLPLGPHMTQVRTHTGMHVAGLAMVNADLMLSVCGCVCVCVGVVVCRTCPLQVKLRAANSKHSRPQTLQAP